MNKQEAQQKAIKALEAAEHYDTDNNRNIPRMESFAVLATAYATLALSLPNEVAIQDARPFREVVQ